MCSSFTYRMCVFPSGVCFPDVFTCVIVNVPHVWLYVQYVGQPSCYESHQIVLGLVILMKVCNEAEWPP